MLDWVSKLFKGAELEQPADTQRTPSCDASAKIEADRTPRPETHDFAASEAQLQPTIVRHSQWWRVQGPPECWLTTQTFYVHEHATLAIEVFNRGGTEAEFETARKKARRRILESQRSANVVTPAYGRREMAQINRLRSQVRGKDRGNAELHFELAAKLLAGYAEYAALKKSGLGLWRKGIRIWVMVKNEEAITRIDRALALGLRSDLDQAKARFIATEFAVANAVRSQPHYDLKAEDLKYSLVAGSKLSSLAALEVKAANDPISQARKTPRAQALARQMVENANRFLARDPGNHEALYILRAGYEFLGNRSKLGEVEQALAEAKSLRRRRSPRQSAKSTAANRVTLRNDGRSLEIQVKEVLQTLGFQARMTKSTGDGGIDVDAFSEHPIYGGRYVVQCKDWLNTQVGEPVVRELYGVVMAEKAVKGILITTGQFTEAAKQFARGKQLELIDGDAFQKLLVRHYRSK